MVVGSVFVGGKLLVDDCVCNFLVCVCVRKCVASAPVTPMCVCVLGNFHCRVHIVLSTLSLVPFMHFV